MVGGSGWGFRGKGKLGMVVVLQDTNVRTRGTNLLLDDLLRNMCPSNEHFSGSPVTYAAGPGCLTDAYSAKWENRMLRKCYIVSFSDLVCAYV
jgi:hypothetical protein